MNCPYCDNEDHKVVDKREANEATRRRRECLRCKKRFTTYERIEPFDLVVVKKDGRREPFNREKLRSGLTKACEKRPIPQEKIGKAVDEIEAELRNEEKKEVLPSRSFPATIARHRGKGCETGAPGSLHFNNGSTIAVPRSLQSSLPPPLNSGRPPRL